MKKNLKKAFNRRKEASSSRKVTSLRRYHQNKRQCHRRNPSIGWNNVRVCCFVKLLNLVLIQINLTINRLVALCPAATPWPLFEIDVSLHRFILKQFLLLLKMIHTCLCALISSKPLLGFPQTINTCILFLVHYYTF